MNASSTFSDRVKILSGTPPGGILDLVDAMVLISRDFPMRLEFSNQACRIEERGSGDWTELPWRKSVFRTALARLHVLCNERVPGSVGPYGGTGELTIPGDPPVSARVVFVNTPDEQRVDLTPIRSLTTASPSVAPIGAEMRESTRPVA